MKIPEKHVHNPVVRRHYLRSKYFQSSCVLEEMNGKYEPHITSPLPSSYLKNEDLPKVYDIRNLNGRNFATWDKNQVSEISTVIRLI